MVITEYEHWLVVRQSRRRRIYRVTLVATVSRTLRTPLASRCPPARKRGGFMQLRWFHIRGVCIAPGCVYRSSSAKQGMGIPGDHVNRVETYQGYRSTDTHQNTLRPSSPETFAPKLRPVRAVTEVR